MADIYEMIAEKYEKWASKKNSMVIAKKMLTDGMSVDAIAKYTDLDETEIREIQDELTDTNQLIGVSK